MSWIPHKVLKVNRFFPDTHLQNGFLFLRVGSFSFFKRKRKYYASTKSFSFS